MFGLRISKALLLLALIVPSISFAQSVPAVTGIEARLIGDTVTVIWEPLPPTSSIAHYQVYFSSKSILANNGEYDDFEQSDGPVSNHTIRAALSSRVIYVSVLAVDTSGNVGTVFLEEDSVVLERDNELSISLEEGDFTVQQQEEPSTETFNLVGAGEKRTTPQEQEQAVQNTVPSLEVPQWQRADLGGTLHLLLTEPLSPTEIQLTFSDFPYVDPAYAQQAFSVQDAAGVPLRLTGIIIDQETIIIGTVTQVRGKVYEVVLFEPIQGLDGSPLDPEHRRAFFQGHLQGGERDAEVSVQAATSAAVLTCTPEEMANPSPIKNLQLASQPDFYGSFVIQARWELQNPCNSLTGYVVRQSRDNGKTFSDPTMVPLNVAGLDIPGAVPGHYTFGISVMNIYGSTSKEVAKTIGIAGPDGRVPGAPEPIVVEKKETKPERKTVAVKVSEPIAVKAPEGTKGTNVSKVPTTNQQLATKSTSKPTKVEKVRKTVVSKLAQTGGGAVAALVTIVGGLGGVVVARRKR
ncbi:MAG: hypothetical protein O2904_02950 [bacterium]|nr:hypothetical protein [bacterium]